MQFNYGRPAPAMSNTERQRRFRERNPGYYGRLHRKRNAAIEARMPAYRAMIAFKTAIALALKPQLALPAPIERIEIPGVTIPFTQAELRERATAYAPIAREAA